MTGNFATGAIYPDMIADAYKPFFQTFVLVSKTDTNETNDLSEVWNIKVKMENSR